MRSVFKSLVLVMAFGTIVPMPAVTGVDDAALRRSIGFFPAAGWVLGLFLWGAMWVTAHLMPHGPAAVVVLAAYVLLTGALHLDGLADTFDALGSRKSAPGALAVMKDSRIGTMGAVAVMLVLMGKVVAFAHLSATAMGVWVVVPVLARTSVVWLMMGTPAARPDGLGALYARQLSKWTVAGATGVGLLTAAALMPWHEALLVVLLAVASTVLWARLIRHRFGGSTGDTYGALLEIVEWVGFLAVTGGWGYGR
ncbi:adenosylcobinamide-GDP ribazoletransferase [Sulfobacillus harzensis]|uniref:Adenosylcobinamide-GDP ribazoletransferase n=1 Tax=Sulfobacillus harzensis TaxID=2729629 RepID=A0A7Y0L6L1_9FIRM|nr:adenosylcobinamide-GDP ribazoletransferase [Sulfobacillus harzensis]NMP23887.1 adenosylcobinamide-GDP ribazoletransferase [Sulfobacillus harzensis]